MGEEEEEKTPVVRQPYAPRDHSRLAEDDDSVNHADNDFAYKGKEDERDRMGESGM